MFSTPCRLAYLICIMLGCVHLTTETGALNAEEGMFPISALKQLDLRAKGLKMDPEDLFSTEQTCLVDGICRVNGCTGSFVSPNGLIITNHHCAYRAIQRLSTPEKDFLKNGFQARKMGDELPAPGYEVRITESYVDVSAKVLDAVADTMTAAERQKAISRRRKEIEQATEKEHPGMRAEVSEMFAGKSYVLFLYTYIKDVRLVFAPPSSVGNFGGDVDNWEWPRHTGDFSFMRAYVSKKGGTAEYSPENVPYRPKKFIPVQAQGVDEGDFVFLLGYPGRTARHKTASFLEYEQKTRLPFVVDQYQWRINTMEKAGQNNRAIALKHISTIKGLANVEKRSRGQLKGLNRAGLVSQRKEQETQLQSFIDSDPKRKQEFGYVLKDIEGVYQELASVADYELNLNGLRASSRTFGSALMLLDMAHETQKPDLERETPFMERNINRTIQRLMIGLRDLDLSTDEKITLEMLRRLSKVEQSRKLAALRDILKTPGDMAAFSNKATREFQLTDPAFLKTCLKKSPAELGKLNDPMMQLAVQLYPEYLRLREVGNAREGKLSKLYGKLIQVKQDFLETNFVPDANATLRMTIGSVKGYSPEDAVYKYPITTLKGVVDKTTGVEPFITPQRVLNCYSEKRFGKFFNPKLKQVPVAILYDTDTTGGNSGSPVINAKGELVGVNFDRAFEATINDFAWNENYSRSIGVDIRYVLWITGVVYEAEHLLREMGVQ